MEVESLPNLGGKNQPAAVSQLNLERFAVGHAHNIPQMEQCPTSIGMWDSNCRLSGLLPSDSNDQEPGAGHHKDERGHHADADDIEASGVAGKEGDGTDLFEHEARKAANGAPNQRGIGYVGSRRRLADAAVKDELNHEQHHDHVEGNHLGALARHQDERAANEDRGQPGKDGTGSMTVGGVKGDLVEVERHSDEDEAGQRRSAAADHQEEVVPAGFAVHGRNYPPAEPPAS